MPTHDTDYNTDVAAWAAEQAELLRSRATNALDWDNLAEEIEAVGISQKREVIARLKLVCHHLLKWQFQPEHQSRSWRTTIRTQRRDLAKVLEDSPSLVPYAAAELGYAYSRGREDAEDETGLLHLPQACPWSIDQVLNIDYLP
jgi:hypothetical protein